MPRERASSNARNTVEFQSAKQVEAAQVRASVCGSVLSAVDAVLAIPFSVVLLVFETFYSGLQSLLVPLAKLVPRTVLGVDWFTANTITLSRVFLALPVAIGLAYGPSPLLPEGTALPFVSDSWELGEQPLNRLPGVFVAAVLIVWHDFLDHVDGIVAVAQRQAGTAAGDDPLFGGFIDAFIDKVFFVLSIWSTLLVTDLPACRAVLRSVAVTLLATDSTPSDNTNTATSGLVLELAVVTVSAVLVAYEVAIATVRVNDFFTEQLAPPKDDKKRRRLRAAMEGKLKQKMTSFGLAFLALAVPNLTQPMLPYAAETGAVLLGLACYMAHKSLAHKLAAYEGWEDWLPAGSAAL